MQQSRRECSDNSLMLARKYKNDGRLARAFAHYLVHWQIGMTSSSQSCCPLDEIIDVFDELALRLQADNRIEDLLSTYQQVYS